MEYAINSAVNIFAGFFPLVLLFGQTSSLFSPTSDADSLAALLKWLQILQAHWEEAHDCLCLSRIRQAAQHNKHATQKDTIIKGSLALLNSANWWALEHPGSNKLKDRYEGTYLVLWVFNHEQKVELDLPDGNHQHPAFHVSKVKPFVDRTEAARSLTTKVSSSHECNPK